MRLMRVLSLCAALALVTACKWNAPLQLSAIQLGRSVNADETIGSPTTSFKPNDSIYVSVQTSDTGSGTIGVKWTFGSRVIGEPSKQVSYKGAAATSFQLQSSGGFPEGAYSVEVFIDGKSVGTRTFSVAR